MMMTVLRVSALLVIFAVSGCVSTEYIPVTPQCTPPSEPVLPAIGRGQLWDTVGDAQYRQIERYINALWGYADEQAAMLEALCSG